MGAVRREASVLHLDLDAFFASVEQRDKPSLRGKPVVVGGVGQRGVVATASYEARVFGVRSAMPAHEARRRCPHAAFLAGRFAAYRAASDQVMRLLRELSPLVEPLSLDEAFVDLRAAPRPLEFSPDEITAPVADLQAYASDELAQIVGKAQAHGLVELANARDDRLVEPERETKSISAEDTFETDVSDADEQRAVLLRQARQVATRLSAAGLFGRTGSIKVPLPDFAPHTRSPTPT